MAAVQDAPELPFFTTRMSTDAVSFAPIDAQREIIEKWRTWYREKAAGFEFKPSEGSNDYYF